MSRNSSRIAFLLLATLLFLTTSTNAAAQPVLIVDRPSLDFLAQGSPEAQKVLVSSSGAPVAYQATAGYWSSASGWLSVTPPSGLTPTTLSIRADSNGLAEGVYFGYVEITSGPGQRTRIDVALRVGTLAVQAAIEAESQGNSARAIPLVIPAQPRSVSLTPTSLTLTGTIGGPKVSGTVTVNSSPSGQTFFFDSLAPAWLSVSPPSGATPITITVSGDPTQIGQTTAAMAKIDIRGPSETFLPVTLLVGAAANNAITANPTSGTFAQTLGGPTPAVQTIQLSSITPVNYTVAVPQDATWLTVSPQSGSTAGGATLTLSANASGLTAGSHTTTITINGPGNSVSIPLTFNVTGGTVTPAITASPAQVSFTQIAAGITPLAQSVQLSSATTVGYSVAVPASATWLMVTPSTGNAPATLTFAVSTSGLSGGPFTTNVTVNGGSSPVIIPVTLTLAGSTAAGLTVSPTNIGFTQVVGGTALPQSVQLTSTTATSFTAGSSATWLSVSPATGQLAANTPLPLTLTVSGSGLPTGTSTGSITITTPGGATATVNVSLTITSTGGTSGSLAVSPPNLSFFQTVGAAPPLTQTVQVSSDAAASFTVTIPPDATWLTVDKTSATTPGTLTFTANGTSLPVGNYTASVTIAGPVNTITLPVTLTVFSNTPGTIVASPPAFVFSQAVGDTSFLLQRLHLDTAPQVATSFVASSNASWLNLSATSGTTPADLVLSVTGAGLSAGTYNSNITISYGGSSLLTIPVSLTVTGGTTGGLSILPLSLSFSQSGAIRPGSQTLQVTSALPVSVTASPGATWLTVTPNTSTTPATFTVSANGAGLSNGTVSSKLTLNAGGAPVDIPVTLAVSGIAPLAISLSPPQVSFSQILGGPTPVSQTVQISSPNITSYTASVPPSATWLTVTPANGAIPGTLTLSVNPAGLTAGPYQTTVTITGGGVTTTLPVALTITGTAVAVSPATLTFSGSATGTNPASQTLSVSSTGNPFAFTAAAATTTGANWLSVTPASGTTPGTLTVTASPVGLPAGQYSGAVTITPSDPSVPAQTVNVTLTVSTSTTAFVRAILNAASEQPGPIAPGEILAITGSNLGPAVGSGPVVLPSGAVATSVAGVRVLFDGIAAPVLFVRSDQVNAVVPYGIFGRVSTRVQVEVAGVPSSPIDLRVADTSPAIFTIDSSGVGQGAIVNQDATVNSPTFAAPRGSYISIYATGEGQTLPGGQDGRIISTDLRMPVSPVSVTIGGVPLQVLYAGSAPGSVSGLLQINVQIPANMTPGGQLPVQLQIGTAVSPLGVTMAVK